MSKKNSYDQDYYFQLSLFVVEIFKVVVSCCPSVAYENNDSKFE